MEDQQALSELSEEPFLKLSAECNFRDEVQYVSAIFNGSLRESGVYFRLAGPGHAMQKDWLLRLERMQG